MVYVRMVDASYAMKVWKILCISFCNVESLLVVGKLLDTIKDDDGRVSLIG